MQNQREKKEKYSRSERKKGNSLYSQTTCRKFYEIYKHLKQLMSEFTKLPVYNINVQKLVYFYILFFYKTNRKKPRENLCNPDLKKDFLDTTQFIQEKN